MGIEKWFNTTFSISRMTWSGESSAEIAQGKITGHIQPISAELVQTLGLTFNKAFTIWCAVDADVEEGDTIEDASYSYSVKAVNVRNYGGNQHKTLIVERHEDYASV